MSREHPYDASDDPNDRSDVEHIHDESATSDEGSDPSPDHGTGAESIESVSDLPASDEPTI